MNTTRIPLRNDQVAGQILTAIASTTRPFQRQAIERVLNNAYPSHRATSVTKSAGAARTGDRVTSVEAANLVKVRPQEMAIMRTLTKMSTPATAAEISRISGIPLNSVSTRMKSLVIRKLIGEVDIVMVEGRRRIRYALTNAGLDHLADLTEVEPETEAA